MTEQNKTTTIPLPVQGKDMDSIMQSLESGVEELFTSNRYQEFLKTMAKFHNYSFNNTMLIAMQRPDATLVTSYKNWQSMGRQVMKGEKGITIIAPAPLYSIRITVNSIRNDGTTRKDPGNGGKPRKIKGFSELMKRGELRIDTFFEKRAHFSEQKEKLSTLSTKRAGKPHKQRVPGSFLNWNE